MIPTVLRDRFEDVQEDGDGHDTRLDPETADAATGCDSTAPSAVAARVSESEVDMTEVLKYSKIGKEDLALKSSASDTSLRVTLPDGTEVVLTKLSLDEFVAFAAVNMNLQQVQNHLLEILTANPSTNTQGRIYLFDTTQDVIRYMDGSVVRELVDLAITQTLTNKTLTSPQIGTVILDTSGNEILGMIVTASAVNYVDIVPSATGQDVIIRAVGDNDNIDLDLQSKGTGIVLANGAQIASFPVGNQGEILFYNGTDWVVLGVGTDGQSLASGGGSANPEWNNECPAAATAEVISAAWTFSTAPTIATPLITGAAGSTPAADTIFTDSIVKAWLKCDAAGAIQDDLNVSSIDDDTAGNLGINWATAFGDGDYAVVAMPFATTGEQFYCTANVQSSGLTDLECFTEDGTQADPLNYMVIAIGRQ